MHSRVAPNAASSCAKCGLELRPLHVPAEHFTQLGRAFHATRPSISTQLGLGGEGLADGVGGLGGPGLAEGAGALLLHVEHVDGLRAEGVDVGGADRDARGGEGGAAPGRARRCGRLRVPPAPSPVPRPPGVRRPSARGPAERAAAAAPAGRAGRSRSRRTAAGARRGRGARRRCPTRRRRCRPGSRPARPAPRRAAVANSAATSASRPSRSGESTVTRAPSSTNSTSIHDAPLRTALGTSTVGPGRRRAGAASSPPRAARRAGRACRSGSPATTTRPWAPWRGRRPR